MILPEMSVSCRLCSKRTSNKSGGGILKNKVIVASILLASTPPSIYAAQLVDTQLSGGTISQGKLISATVDQIYDDGGNQSALTKGKIIHADSISTACTKTKKNSLTARISELKVVVAEPVTLNPVVGTSIITGEKIDVRLSSAALDCVHIASKDVKIDSDPSAAFASDIEVSVTDAVLEKVAIKNAEVPTSAISNEKPQSTIATASNMPLIGDYNQLNVRLRITNVLSGKQIEAPKYSCFRVNKDTSKEQPKDAKLYGSFIGSKDMNLVKRVLLQTFGDCGNVSSSDTTEYEGMLGQEFVISKEDLESTYDRTRYGFSYGVLVTPFKFYPKQSHFESRATVGGYVGWRMHDRQGASNVIALALGPTTATVNNVSMTGVSTALSWHGDIKDSFTVGAMLGADFFSKAANVPYAGKAWLGATLGYKLEQ